MIYSNSFEYFFLATCSMDIPCLESNNKEATIDGLQPATAYLFEISVTTDSNDLDSMSITKKCKTNMACQAMTQHYLFEGLHAQ